MIGPKIPNMDDALPCPFCSQRPVLYRQDGEWRIACSNQACPTRPGTRSAYGPSVLRMWNTRDGNRLARTTKPHTRAVAPAPPSAGPKKPS
jgi:hypothetical protein